MVRHCKAYKLRPEFLFCIALLFFSISAVGQNDTSNPKKNSLIDKVLSGLKKDTSEVDRVNMVRRNDERFFPYSGFIIRRINITRLTFGTPFNDTSKSLTTTLTRIANAIHHKTKTDVIRNNLFFKKNDTISPYLIADNERYLRELPYLRDADILIKKVGETDSADVTVIIKDLFSFGGSIGSLGLNKTQIELREDNFAGTGNAGVIYALYDNDRKNNFAFGGEIIRRNIGGSFITQKIGYQSFYNSVDAPREENFYYYNLSKPLLNRFMRWTYELNASYHSTSNKYVSDSLYLSDYRYRFYDFEAWLGFNINAKYFTLSEENKKLRKLAGIRIITRNFAKVPKKYQDVYNWQFADLTAALGTFTFYRQNFYKTKYVYGFGRNEDIPEGLSLSLTAGYTIKSELSRPFIGFNYERYGFNKRGNYLNYTVRSEGYLGNQTIEDINVLASINYFDRLKQLNERWKQRFFLSLTASKQINTILNQPLFVNSKFGFPEYGNQKIGGDLRISGKIESAFFSPWSLAGFQFAPLLFSNITLFTPYKYDAKVYSSIGAGIRTRNESLIFGTIDLRGFYFPQGNYYGDHFGVELSTNIIFKKDNEFIKKPDFIEVN